MLIIKTKVDQFISPQKFRYFLKSFQFHTDKMLLFCDVLIKLCYEPQDEDAGLKMMPSAFLSDLEVANKRFDGRFTHKMLKQSDVWRSFVVS